MADFMHRFKPSAKIYIPIPTWSNHHSIWADANVEEKTFRWYKPETKGLDFEGMMQDIKGAETGSFFLFHACAHNPTGVDPSVDQWKQMSKVRPCRLIVSDPMLRVPTVTALETLIS
jgi:aspartate aminotransferase